MPGQTLVFKSGEPYGQVLIVPRKISYDLNQMTTSEAMQRVSTDDKLNKYCKKFVTNDWKDHIGHNFDDKYKVLRAVFNKHGSGGVEEFLDAVAKAVDGKRKFRGKLVMKRKNESIQD